MELATNPFLSDVADVLTKAQKEFLGLLNDHAAKKVLIVRTGVFFAADETYDPVLSERTLSYRYSF